MQQQLAWDKICLRSTCMQNKNCMCSSEFLLEGPGCSTVAIHTSRASKICVVKNPYVARKKKITTDKTQDDKARLSSLSSGEIVAACSMLASHLQLFSPSTRSYGLQETARSHSIERKLSQSWKRAVRGWRGCLPTQQYCYN